MSGFCDLSSDNTIEDSEGNVADVTENNELKTKLANSDITLLNGTLKAILEVLHDINFKLENLD
ncbi:MAG: hypothetical protein OEL89_00375 [Candidatus Peregrinibacteria bacterium]|nr:hypothetical protein [Candidatus Peregrinibacteria bacterium]